MNSPAVSELLRPAMQVNTLLWVSLNASILIYGVVAYLNAQASGGPTEVSVAIELALAGAALVTGLGSLLVMRIFLSDHRLREAMRSDPDPEDLARHPKLRTIDEERLRKIQSLSRLDRKLLQVPQLYFTPLIIRLVLNEAIAIYGLVLAFLTHSFPPVLPFAAMAIALNLTCLPRIEPVLERAARLAH